MSFELELARAVDSAAMARRALDDLGDELPEDQLGDVRLLVSELVTNSLRHAELDETDAIQLSVTVTDATVHVEVTDPGRGFDPVEDVRSDPDRSPRWGFLLVETLADRWGVDRTAGTRVWFELDRPGAQAA